MAAVNDEELVYDINHDDLEDPKYISKGNFGTIYRASYFGTDVAVKQLMDVGNTKMAKYIQREMDLLKTMRHPHIVQFMGLCKHEGNVFIVTEYVEGGDLYDALRHESQLGWKKRVRIAVEACQAICYLHSRGVIHRDLKSQNLLVDKNWKVKVCDFGFARANDPMAYMTLCGTDEWMAPEIILGERYDEKADVFSFGMILCELITRADPPVRFAGNAYGFEFDNFRKSVPENCPEVLLECLKACASFYSDERPVLKDVLKKLKDLEASLPEDENIKTHDLSQEMTYMTIGEPEEAPKEVEEVEDDKKKKKKKKKREPSDDPQPLSLKSIKREVVDAVGVISPRRREKKQQDAALTEEKKKRRASEPPNTKKIQEQLAEASASPSTKKKKRVEMVEEEPAYVSLPIEKEKKKEKVVEKKDKKEKRERSSSGTKDAKLDKKAKEKDAKDKEKKKN